MRTGHIAVSPSRDSEAAGEALLDSPAGLPMKPQNARLARPSRQARRGQPEGFSRLLHRRSDGGRPRPDRNRGQVAPGGPGPAQGFLRAVSRRRGVPRRRAHLAVRVRAPGRTTFPNATASCCCTGGSSTAGRGPSPRGASPACRSRSTSRAPASKPRSRSSRARSCTTSGTRSATGSSSARRTARCGTGGDAGRERSRRRPRRSASIAPTISRRPTGWTSPASSREISYTRGQIRAFLARRGGHRASSSNATNPGSGDCLGPSPSATSPAGGGTS